MDGFTLIKRAHRRWKNSHVDPGHGRVTLIRPATNVRRWHLRPAVDAKSSLPSFRWIKAAR